MLHSRDHSVLDKTDYEAKNTNFEAKDFMSEDPLIAEPIWPV